MKPTFKKKILVIFILIILCFLLFKVFKVQEIFLKAEFPLKYSEIVYKYSKEFNVDPLMIFAIIKAESNFNSSIESKSDAIGLMQLLDKTAEETANKLDIEYKGKDSLCDAETNIKLGIKYYSELMKMYEGNNILAITAYNAGPGNVKTWIENKIIQKDGSDIENIPFKETNNYVRKILRNYKIYNKLYNLERMI